MISAAVRAVCHLDRLGLRLLYDLLISGCMNRICRDHYQRLESGFRCRKVIGSTGRTDEFLRRKTVLTVLRRSRLYI